MDKNSFAHQVINFIKLIPAGRVSTYGTIATLAGSPGSAREVGYILHSLTQKHNLPWQRVVNRKGYISIRGEDVNMKSLQKKLLEQEDVEVSQDFMIDLTVYGWFGEKKVVGSSKLEK